MRSETAALVPPISHAPIAQQFLLTGRGRSGRFQAKRMRRLVIVLSNFC